MSDTPETDAFLRDLNDYSDVELRAMTEHARKLERERDEAREKLENEMKWHHQTHQELVEAQCKLLDIEYDKLKS